MKEKVKKYSKRVVFIIQLLTMIGLMIMAYMVQLIPMKYLAVLGIVLLVILFVEYKLVFYKKEKSKRSLVAQVICVILSCVMILGSSFIYKMGKTVNLLTDTSFQKRAISVIVLKDSKIKNEKQLAQSHMGYISSIDGTTMTYAIAQIREAVGSFRLTNYDDFQQLLESLYQKNVDAIIMDEAFRSLIEQEKETFSEDTRVVFQVTKDESVVSAKNVDVTQKPFLIYISGIDEYGDLSTVSRSDVNMLVAVNPTTKQILLISIPRDTYYPLHMNGSMDKFTHAGVYGLQESIETLQDMIDENINYYARMNFTSFIDIVDAMGGITVNSPHAFTTKIGGYEIQEGKNVLNAKEALAFVRERKSFVDGDFERGRNQQRMIAAIVKKVCSPAILTSFSSILDTVSRSVETNLSSSEINALVQMQLSDMPSWDVQSYQIIGTSMSMPCYSLGGLSASVVVPSELSLEQATEYIDQLLAGEMIQTENGNLDQ